MTWLWVGTAGRACSTLAASIGAKSAILRMVDYTKREVGFFDAVGIDPAYRQAYARHFINVDIYQDMMETAPVGAVIRSSWFLSHEERNKTEFFNDYQKPQDMEYVIGSALARNNDFTVQFGAHRGRRARDFGQGEFSSTAWRSTILPLLTVR